MLSVILFTLTSIPILLCVEFSSNLHSSAAVLGLGVGVLLLATAGVFLLLPKPAQKDNWFYVFTLFAFCCVIDLLLSLEAQGLVSGVGGFYFRSGEEYLDTPFGLCINLWDGIVHYTLYLGMIRRMYQGKSYRNLGLYWAGSILNSVVVLLFGGLTSGLPLHPAIFLNIPFTVIPVYFIGEELSRSGTRVYPMSKAIQTVTKAFCTQGSIGTIIRVLALTPCAIGFIQNYRTTVEPSLANATSFQKVQLLFLLCDCVPFFAYGSFKMFSGSTEATDFNCDLALIFAGVVGNAQAGLIGPYFLGSTNPELDYAPPSGKLFWVVQAWFFLGVHILAFAVVRVRRSGCKTD